jgi:outer membrane protein TolC
MKSVQTQFHQKAGDEMGPISISILKRVLFSFILFLPVVSPGQPEAPLLNLDQLVQEAGRNNPEVQAARQKWEAYKEKVPQASALEDPKIGLGIVSLPTNFRFKDEDMTMKEISISQMVPFPGKRPLMKEMAEREAESVYIEIQEKINRIVREVKGVFYELSHVHRDMEVTRKNKAVLENLAKIVESRYAVGEGIQQDILKARVEISKMLDDLIMLEQKKRSLEAKLNSLLNRPPETTVGKPEEISFRKLSFGMDELQKSAMEMNPVLKGMKKMIEAKEKARELAKKEYYPDFDFRFAYGQRDNGSEGRRRDMLSGMVMVNIPIFYKSKQERKVAEIQAEIQALESQYQGMKNEIQYMVADMGSMMQRSEKQLELYKTGILPQADLQIQSAMSAYRVNKADFMTLLDSQMTYYRYELQYHQALTDYDRNAAGLEAAVGMHLARKEDAQ